MRSHLKMGPTLWIYCVGDLKPLHFLYLQDSMSSPLLCSRSYPLWESVWAQELTAEDSRQWEIWSMRQREARRLFYLKCMVGSLEKEGQKLCVDLQEGWVQEHHDLNGQICSFRRLPTPVQIPLIWSSMFRGRQQITTVLIFVTCPRIETEDLGTMGEQTRLVHRHGGWEAGGWLQLSQETHSWCKIRDLGLEFIPVAGNFALA